ncbi:MAG: SdrD B-like domain-containing protein [Planctomycetota bacterium]
MDRGNAGGMASGSNWSSGSSAQGPQASFWERLFSRRQRRSSQRTGAGRAGGRALRLEPLESRALMALTNLGAITGRVFLDANNNGFTAGEQVANATVRLFRDNGDSTFNPATDTSVSQTTTNAQGIYRFDSLTAGTYWVQQIAQTVGGVALSEKVVQQTISATAATGTNGLRIDGYTTATPAIEATLPATTANGVGVAAEAVGGERDLVMNIISGGPGDKVQFGVSANRLNLTADAGAVGQGSVTWDGVDGNATTLNPTGLGGVDLTSNGASTGLRMSMGADHAGATVKTTVYTNAGNRSTLTLTIPEITPQDPNPELLLPFSSFTIEAGTGANFANVGAIEVDIDTTVNGTDVRGELFGAVGPTVFTQDFNNLATVDLVVTKAVSDSTPDRNQPVTFTVTVTNSSPITATGVALTDNLPPGVTFVSVDPTSNGSYSSTTGIWNVGTLAPQAVATLKLITNVTGTVTTSTNTATVSAVDQVDSNPNNNTASASVTPNILDLTITKTVNAPIVLTGQEATFTVTAINNGPIAATGVQVTDVLPTGLEFARVVNASQGTYNNSTGIWNVGNLGTAAGQNSANLQIAAKVVATGFQPITNVARISAVDQFESNLANNTAQATISPGRLSKRNFLADTLV